MKNIITFFILVIVMSGYSFPAKEEHSKMDSFKWVIGNWGMKTSRGLITESWAMADDNSYTGESKMVKTSGESRLLEKIQLLYRGDDYYYIPTAQGQNNNQPVKFIITSHSENGFVAENPEHDFPKRIIYNLINKDSIHAFIDGGPAMPDKKSDFYYSRNKN